MDAHVDGIHSSCGLELTGLEPKRQVGTTHKNDSWRRCLLQKIVFVF